MELARSTEAFITAQQLDDGGVDKYAFSTEKEADSFRTSLYATRRKLNDNTILISISGKVVTLTKVTKAVIHTRIAPDGTEIEVTKNREESSYRKAIEKIIEEAEELVTGLGFSQDAKAEYISERIEALGRKK